MAQALRIVGPVLVTQNLRNSSNTLRREIQELTHRLSASDDEDRLGRLVEAARLLKLAEELYERADKLVKQAEELFPPDDRPSLEQGE